VNLKDRLRFRLIHPDGSLMEVPKSTLQQLARKRQVKMPLTPLMGSLLGASPDQVKMLGDKRQKQAALRLEAPTLAEALRYQSLTKDRQLNKERKGALKKAKSLAPLTNLQKRVQTLVHSKKFLKEVKPVRFLKPKAGTSRSMEVALRNFSIRGDSSDYNRLVHELGRTPSAKDLLSLYRSADDMIIDTLVKNIADKITIGDLSEDLGYSNAELSTLLHVPDVSLLSIAGFRDALSTLISEEFSEVDNLNARSQDPSLNAMEREELLTELRTLGSSGLRTQERAMKDLHSSLEGSERVEFMGKTYTTEELLRDKTLSSILRQYLTADPNSELARGFREKNPHMASFIQENRETLTAKTAVLKHSATTKKYRHDLRTERSKYSNIMSALRDRMGWLKGHVRHYSPGGNAYTKDVRWRKRYPKLAAQSDAENRQELKKTEENLKETKRIYNQNKEKRKKLSEKLEASERGEDPKEDSLKAAKPSQKQIARWRKNKTWWQQTYNRWLKSSESVDKTLETLLYTNYFNYSDSSLHGDYARGKETENAYLLALDIAMSSLYSYKPELMDLYSDWAWARNSLFDLSPSKRHRADLEGAFDLEKILRKQFVTAVEPYL